MAVLFMVCCSAYTAIAKVHIDSWYIAGATGLLMVALMHIGMRRIKCPRCASSLSHAAYTELSSVRPPVAACPNCNVSLDEPM